MFKRFGFNTSTVGHTTLKVLAGVTLMYAEKGDKMVLLPFTLEVLVVMTVFKFSSKSITTLSLIRYVDKID